MVVGEGESIFELQVLKKVKEQESEGPLSLSFDFIYLFMREREREREREKPRQGKKQAPCREPNVGLDPGTPGSLPGLKAGTKPLSHPRVLGLTDSLPVCKNHYACVPQ